MSILPEKASYFTPSTQHVQAENVEFVKFPLPVVDLAFMSNTTTVGVSRAVVRAIEPGSSATCQRCDEPVKFMARVNGRQVIANVYEGGKWNRVEHFHFDCYDTAERPYGEPLA